MNVCVPDYFYGHAVNVLNAVTLKEGLYKKKKEMAAQVQHRARSESADGDGEVQAASQPCVRGARTTTEYMCL